MADINDIRICGMMKTTLLDFPGRVACTLFLPGCNMRCPFCHNSRVVHGTDELISKDEIFSFLKKRIGILDGVCITGGEPTLYGEALTELIKEIKELGYLVKLDTNGTSPELLSSLIEKKLIDYVAMDVKTVPDSDEVYSRVCGRRIDVSSILDSISILKQDSVDYEFRTTAVHPLHTADDLVRTASYLKGGRRYFLQSFVDSGELLCKNEDFSPLEKQEMQRAADSASVYLPTFVRGI